MIIIMLYTGSKSFIDQTWLVRNLQYVHMIIFVTLGPMLHVRKEDLVKWIFPFCLI